MSFNSFIITYLIDDNTLCQIDDKIKWLHVYFIKMNPMIMNTNVIDCHYYFQHNDASFKFHWDCPFCDSAIADDWATVFEMFFPLEYADRWQT